MINAKEITLEILKRLPDDCTIEDIQYQLFVVSKIQKSMERIEEEGTISHEEVEKKDRTMAYKIKWSPEAVEDLEAIYNFIARDSIYYANL